MGFSYKFPSGFLPFFLPGNDDKQYEKVSLVSGENAGSCAPFEILVRFYRSQVGLPSEHCA